LVFFLKKIAFIILFHYIVVLLGIPRFVSEVIMKVVEKTEKEKKEIEKEKRNQGNERQFLNWCLRKVYRLSTIMDLQMCVS